MALPEVDLPVPSVQIGNEDGIEVFLVMKNLIEAFAGKAWLEHPARQRTPHLLWRQWLFCDEAIANAGRVNFKLAELAERWKVSTLLDAHDIRAASGAESYGELGTFGLYLDGANEALSRTRAKRDIGYRSVLSEFSAISTFLANGFNVAPITSSSRTEFLATHSRSGLALMVECKQPQSVSPNAIRSAVESANKKFKNTGGADLPGLLLIDLRGSLGVVDMQTAGTIPEAVREVVLVLQQILNREYSSISNCMLIWDELGIKRRKTDPNIQIVFCARKSLNVAHRSPKHRMPTTMDLSFYGAFTSFEIHSKAPVRSRISFLRKKKTCWYFWTQTFVAQLAGRPMLSAYDPSSGWAQWRVDVN